MPYFSVMADKCTDITTIEELSVFCHWEENGVPVESFFGNCSFKKADAESIYLAVVKCLKGKNPAILLVWGLMVLAHFLVRKLVNKACVHYPDYTMEIFSLLTETSRII